MAKRGTLEHPKTLKLGRRLGIPPCFALGVLEALWHWAAKYARDGKISAEPWQVAEAIRYPGDEGALFEALIECGWIDEIEGELYIHDWADHADNAVKKTLANRGEKFATGEEPFRKNGAIAKKDLNLEKEVSGKSAEISGKSAHFSSLPEPEPEPEPEPITPLTPLAGGEPPGTGLAAIVDPVPEPYEWWLDYDSSSFERLLVEAIRGSPCYRSGVFVESDFGELAQYVAGFAPDPITVENEIGRIGEWLAKKRKRPWADNPTRGLRAWFAKCESNWRGLRRAREYDARKPRGTLDMLAETKRILAEGGSKLIALPIVEDEFYAEG
jgi:hypothetical protein